MADLPPLEQMPDLQPGESVSPNARFAVMFGKQDKSLAQRARHNEDIRAFAEELQRQREAHQQEELRTDKGARDLHFRQQAADLRERLAVQNQARADELHQKQLENIQARTEAAYAMALERLAREKEADQKATRIANARTEVFNGLTSLRSRGLTPKDNEYKNGVMDLLIQHGDALGNPEKKALTDEIKVTTPTDPIDASEQAIAGMAALKDAAKQKGMNVSTSWMMSPTGRASVRVNEIRPTAPPRPPANPELTRLKSQLGQMEADQIAMRPEDSSATSEKQQESLFKQRSAMEPSMKLLREKIASMEAAQAPATAVPAAPASSQPVAPPIQPAPAGPTAALLGITPTAPAPAPEQPPVPAQQPERPKLGDIFK